MFFAPTDRFKEIPQSYTVDDASFYKDIKFRIRGRRDFAYTEFVQIQTIESPGDEGCGLLREVVEQAHRRLTLKVVASIPAIQRIAVEYSSCGEVCQERSEEMESRRFAAPDSSHLPGQFRILHRTIDDNDGRWLITHGLISAPDDLSDNSEADVSCPDAIRPGWNALPDSSLDCFSFHRLALRGICLIEIQFLAEFHVSESTVMVESEMRLG